MGQQSKRLTAALHLGKQHKAWGETPTLCITLLSGSQSANHPLLVFLLTLGEAASLAGGCYQLSYWDPAQAPALVPHESKRLPLTGLPASTRGILQLLPAVTGTSNGDVYAKPRLHKLLLPPRDECLKQTALPYAQSTGISALGIPRWKHESGWGRCLNKSR